MFESEKEYPVLSNFDGSADSKSAIHRFITALYGSSLHSGALITWTKQNKQSRAFEKLDDLDNLSDWAEKLKGKNDIYFEIGLQKSAPLEFNRGKQESVVTIPGLWMDIDIKGPGHKRLNLPESKEDAFKLVDAFGLTPSIVVSSGGGLHVYWLFEQPWIFSSDDDRTNAMELSRQFQHEFIAHGKRNGYELDYCGDLNRLLRLPETLNHKNDPKPVEILKFNPACRYTSSRIREWFESIRSAERPSDVIVEGRRNTTITMIAGQMRARGLVLGEILGQLQMVNRQRCQPPLTDEEVERIAQSVAGYEPGSGNSEQATTQAQRLVALGEGLNLFHTGEGEPYAQLQVNGHNENWPLRSKAVRHHLDRLYQARHGGAFPSSQARQTALGVLEGKALYESHVKEVFVRVAEADGCLYLDLCNQDWEAAQISPAGWQVVKNPPVLFVRSKGMLELPSPEKGGKLDQLFAFMNADEPNKCLITAFLIASLRPSRPFPILILQGEQGSAKSTTARIIRELVDPSASPLRTLPKGDRDLMIMANNCWLLAYDNLSGIPVSMSDALCRISTGGGFSSRALYTDGDEKIFNSKRPVILNGIDDLANRGDLADRSIIVTLPRIPQGRRRIEDEMWRDFYQAKPKILGALLDAVSFAIGNIEHVTMDALPRMADFAKWVVAAEPALPWDRGYFVKVYNANHVAASQNVLESDPVARVLHDFIVFQSRWEGTATELLAALEGRLGDERVKYSKAWPKTPSYLSGRVRRLAPMLREIGFIVEQTIKRGTKLWRFEAPKKGK